ncbi:MAG TPA: zf-HC2 domain-containing protein [Vicinamibacteria bacterium]|jgi:hypothetical protein
MGCDKAVDEALQGDKLDVLYGEADAAARARVSTHLASCGACREEMAGLGALRRELGRWRLPLARPGFTPRGYVVPRWLAAAALFLLAFAGTVGASGYLSLRRALQAQEARAAIVERQQRETQKALEAQLARTPVSAAAAQDLLQRVDARVDARLASSDELQRARLDRLFADWQDRAEVRRRVDMAQVAASLSYLDGRHGEQLQRTNELMGYVLASQKR